MILYYGKDLLILLVFITIFIH